MDTQLLDQKFTRIGARLKVVSRTLRWSEPQLRITLDIASDRHGEFFEVNTRSSEAASIEVLDVRPQQRHLLLLVRQNGEKSKFLCGHDERHWFVAGIPESAPVGTVPQAMQALQPPDVQNAIARKRRGAKGRYRRKNPAFLRQGEWFFLPAPELFVDELRVLQNEPLRRGRRGKPHWAEFCYRTGGETVYVSGRHPNGLTEAKYQKLLTADPQAKRWRWQIMRRNPGVYVRGRIRHSDHATITLNGWHRVVLNTEMQSLAMRHVAFLD